MLSLIHCTTYQNFMRFYKMVRLLLLVKNPGMEPVVMILPLTSLAVKEDKNVQVWSKMVMKKNRNRPKIIKVNKICSLFFCEIQKFKM